MLVSHAEGLLVVLLILVGLVVLLDGVVKRAEVGGCMNGCTHRHQGEELLEAPETPRGCGAASLLLPGKGLVSYIRLHRQPRSASGGFLPHSE